jgi:cytidylate kinase
VEFDKEYASLPTFWERFDAQREKQRDEMVNMLNRVIKAVAHHGKVVILGRSGFEVLSGFADVLHVRLQAPFRVRAWRVMENEGIPFEQAEELVRQNDKVRLAFVEEFYKVPWGSIQAFDLIINTGKVSADLATDMIVQAAHAFQTDPQSDKPSLAVIEVDRILEETVSEVLKCQKVHE